VRVPISVREGCEIPAEVITFNGLDDGLEHIALRLGARGGRWPLVRMHSECLTGDVFGSARCDCGPQLAEAIERIHAAGGIVLYMRQEGRSIGLYNKLDAYSLQDQGFDTYEANTRLGLPADGRDYRSAAQMLHTLGIGAINLLTNNPDKASQLARYGIHINQVSPTGVFITPSNRRYLEAKVGRTHHSINLKEKPA
jgi:GTP cyclohydrolase II